MSDSRLDPRLYNADIAKAFREQAKLHTKSFSAARRFLMQVAKALEGKPSAHWLGIVSSERCVLLTHDKTRQYEEVLEKVCESIPEVRWSPSVEFFAYGIFAARRYE